MSEMYQAALEPLFVIPDTGKSDIPVDQLHYWNWLSENNFQDINSVKTKRDYLESLGFKVGIDFLSIEDLSILRSVEQIYFYSTKHKQN